MQHTKSCLILKHFLKKLIVYFYNHILSCIFFLLIGSFCGKRIIWESHKIKHEQSKCNSTKQFLSAEKVHQNLSQASMHTLPRWLLPLTPTQVMTVSNPNSGSLTSQSDVAAYLAWRDGEGSGNMTPFRRCYSILNLYAVTECIPVVSWQPFTTAP